MTEELGHPYQLFFLIPEEGWPVTPAKTLIVQSILTSEESRKKDGNSSFKLNKH